MLDDNPVLRERTMGLAALAAIGLGGAIAVDLLVTGGFDFAPRSGHDRQQASTYVRVVDAANYVSDGFHSIGWDQTSRRPADTSASEERLAGPDDGSPPGDEFNLPAGDLYSQIAALYAESESFAEEPAHEEPAYEDGAALDEPSYEASAEADYAVPSDKES
jgi:hypothetical protein